ncbi:MAG: FtsX-like permease family protein [Bacteroidia bacterium]|nr:FtsX-like permease family protein [Bacteroidia bacterium]
MIIKIAFKNIWRNSLRSWTVIIAITLGIFGGLAVISTATGLSKMRQNNAIDTYISHIQIHDTNYLQYARINDTIFQKEELISFIKSSKFTSGISSRIKTESFIQSAGGTSGVILNGIIPYNEKNVTGIYKKLDQGNYLKNYKRKPPIIISQILSTKLNAKINTTIQCTFLNAQGESSVCLFKVVDIYNTNNSLYDEVNAFVKMEDLREYTQLSGIHEIVIKLENEFNVESFRSKLIQQFPNHQIDSWRGIAPELGYADKMMNLILIIFLIIIMLALAFGIINTMLMAVLERKKELGMLLSIGMNKRKVFWMIIWESIFLALISGPLGLLSSYLAITTFANHGIDLSFAATGLKSVGIESTIYPYVENRFYYIISFLVILTAILSSIYPAMRALKLNPSETLRTSN